MSEKEDLFPFGYGRGWSEPKATGIARLFQIGREPATRTSMYWIAAVTLAIYAAIIWTVIPLFM